MMASARSRIDPFSTANGCPDASGDPMAARMSELARAMPGYISHKVFTADDGSAHVSVPRGVNRVAVNNGQLENLAREIRSDVQMVEIESPDVNTGVGAPPSKKRNPVKKK